MLCKSIDSHNINITSSSQNYYLVPWTQSGRKCMSHFILTRCYSTLRVCIDVFYSSVSGCCLFIYLSINHSYLGISCGSENGGDLPWTLQRTTVSLQSGCYLGRHKRQNQSVRRTTSQYNSEYISGSPHGRYRPQCVIGLRRGGWRGVIAGRSSIDQKYRCSDQKYRCAWSVRILWSRNAVGGISHGKVLHTLFLRPSSLTRKMFGYDP